MSVFRVFSGLFNIIWAENGIVNLRIQCKYGKIRNRKNCRYGQFLCRYILVKLYFSKNFKVFTAFGRMFFSSSSHNFKNYLPVNETKKYFVNTLESYFHQNLEHCKNWKQLKNLMCET